MSAYHNVELDQYILDSIQVNDDVVLSIKGKSIKTKITDDLLFARFKWIDKVEEIIRKDIVLWRK